MTDEPGTVRLKECANWTSTACLSGSTNKQVTLVGYEDPIVCITLQHSTGE